MRRSVRRSFRMRMGTMLVDYKLQSRDTLRHVRVEEARVDPSQQHTVAPMHWLEALRSPSRALPKGYFSETETYIAPPAARTPGSRPAPVAAAGVSMAATKGGASGSPAPNAVIAGPLIMYIDGVIHPIPLNVAFVDEDQFAMRSADDCNLHVGLDAISQCTLFNELRPGGLLARQSVRALKPLGMQTGLAESPLVPRPWTRMKYMFIDELQRGPKLEEYVGYNARVGTPWRFSQHCKYFREGIRREINRKDQMHEGLHAFSSWQKSPQQSVPEVRFLAPSP